MNDWSHIGGSVLGTDFWYQNKSYNINFKPERVKMEAYVQDFMQNINEVTESQQHAYETQSKLIQSDFVNKR